MTKATSPDCPIIALDRFIRATRDSGYKGTASAISELIDNSLQAGATRIEIALTEVAEEFPLQVRILDNGAGMDPFTLREALRFGGSSRFDDRSGLGRYGMGLPNSSLSQARRVTVFTWQNQARGRGAVPEFVWTSYLDVDEIADGKLEHVPPPRTAKPVPEECVGPSGTLVVWERCDRLDNRRIATLQRKLSAELGRRFRHFILGRTKITINGAAVEPVDPLFLTGKSVGGSLFGEESVYEVYVDPDAPERGTGKVRVRFAELPVAEWGGLPNERKAQLGVSKGSGVSIVRGLREVDYGWFFMGEKRRENYDDWWRCEIQFDPALDEAFGITHTKQQIRPQAHLLEALSQDLEETARALNQRARKAHMTLKAAETFQEATGAAAKVEPKLKPLPPRPTPRAAAVMEQLRKSDATLRKPKGASKSTKAIEPYRIVVAALREATFFDLGRDDSLTLALNPAHPFYARVFQPLQDSDTPRDRALRVALEFLLLAAIRAEAVLSAKDAEVVHAFRKEWSANLAAFLNAR